MFYFLIKQVRKPLKNRKKRKKNKKDPTKPVIQENKEEIKQVTEPNNDIKETNINSKVTVEPEKTKTDPNQQPKKNPIAKIIDEDGIVGIMLLASNLVETLNTAVITLFKGLHIYSLYVKMIVGGADADEIARAYGRICGFYYPLKGMILNGMKVDQYDDYIQPDFIAPANEYGFQLIASINIALILKIGIKAGAKFLVNLIKNK